ncbi:UDP-N-acetylmuramoyl-L-alanine--D-glutamate ligase [Kordiimonas sp.]|uniref:UDP-N-acetylmuramoyl-L-alanine--D-glutamate ligase n=1 Tax=Kordiimonas sp. TaxID=1970157 RepID=UPI003A925930
MITASAYKGKKVGVFGLARTGVAAVRALEASGAEVLAWDDAPERQAAVGPSAHNLYDADMKTLDAVMLAPGVPLNFPTPHALVVQCREAGTALISDFDFFEAARADMARHKIVAITGTNGKSTTTALIGHVVSESGKPAAVGGNIGRGILSLDPLPEGGVYVFEMSSFQLDLTTGFKADVGILLNITPDHLDRHGSLEGYVAAKQRLFEQQDASGVAVISVDDAHGASMAATYAGRVVPISVEKPVAGGVYVLDGLLTDDMRGDALVVADLRKCAPMLLGSHNWQNAAAAYAAGRSLGLETETIISAFTSFPGLAHRQETIATIEGVRYINDSKATNVDAASRALKAFENIHWIAGGRPKEKNFTLLAPLMTNVKQAYLIGEAADAIAHDVGTDVTVIDCRDMEHALECARANASAGDVILLSPACTAFDQFRDFENRGDVFRALVLALEGERS